MFRKVAITFLLAGLLSCGAIEAAQLSVVNVTMQPGATDAVVVSGDIAGELTFGVTILVEIVPRIGNTGTVTFTLGPPDGPVDVIQLGDPWPTSGTFDIFDTDLTSSGLLNGSVDDDGNFQCTGSSVTFSGPLTGFPVVASSDADGVWDVLLSTSAGDSLWQCVTPTTLIAGTITVIPGECIIDTDCDDTIACTDDTCANANCVFTPNDTNCTDDGFFCTGSEICDPIDNCVSAGNPCQPNEFCNEAMATCDQCQVDADCDDGVACTDDTCVTGSCLFTTNDANCPDDGLFCTGNEVCNAVSDCVSTGSPCLLSEVCDDVTDACTTCTIDIDCDDGNVCTDDACSAGACVQTNNTVACDDGLFCTATDVCGGGVCVGSGDPCAGLVCDDTLDACLGPTASLSAVSLQVGHGANVSLIVAGEINGFDTFGVTLSVELAPRSGTTGTVQFTLGPPSDILQIDDAWPGAGTFTSFDTNVTGSVLLNGAVDDNGTFVSGPVSFNGDLASFPLIVSDDAGGTWDILLSTSAGDSSWEGVATTLAPGTIVVEPPVGLQVNSFAMPPDATTNVIVSGVVDNQLTFGFTALLELIPQAGATGTLTFTPAPPVDIVQIDDVWPGVGIFSAFDTDPAGTGSLFLNGCLDDNGTFEESLVNFRGDLASFPLVSSLDANGVWDVTLSTSTGNSSWENLATVLIDGTITVTPGACLVNADCDDTNVCTDDVCVAGVCASSDNTSPCDDGDQCTSSDTCALGVCVGVPISEGSSCDDGNLCAINDVCIGGICAGTPVICSSLDSACGVGTCNAATGLCEVSPINETGACDDGSLCTQNDVCTGGVCGGTPVDCTSLDAQCLLGSCDPATGLCQAVPLIDSTLCDDGDLCTENDACTAGVCSGTALDCSSLDDGCIVGACNATTGVCESVAVNEGDPCSDGVACTAGDTCTGGVCAGTPKDCTSLDTFCSTGTCNVVTGVCERTAVNESLGCDDGFTCTTGDQCASGFCTGTLVDPPTIDLTLSPSSPTVQSGDTIQVDLIASSGTCANQPTASLEVIIAWNPAFLELTGKVDNAALWPDSEFPDDSALDGLNAPFNGLPGNDGDGYYLAFAGFSLANASFVPASGQLVASFQFLALDAALNTPINILPSAGLFTTTRALLAGPGAGADITGALSSASVQVIECQTGGDCSDGNVCTDDVCTNGICSNVDNIATCDDGLFCTATDTCANGVCGGVDDPCTTPQLCSEGLDACVECLSNLDCVDGNVCTTDTCDALGACVHPNNTAVCDDGLFCTATDECSGGGCVGIGDRCPGQFCNENADACVDCLVDANCFDGNLCTDETCNTVTGLCEFTNNTVACNDGLFCTATDTCSNGACVGSGDPCPGQLCSDNVDACVECLLDSQCDDSNVCTNDDCIAGTCVNIDNTDPCDDGVFCTANDVCNAGACVGSGDPCPGLSCDEGGSRCVECFADLECDDAIDCTIDQCDFAEGVCLNSPDDPFCDDGAFCNGLEVCSLAVGCFSPGSPCGNPALCDEVNDRCDCELPTLVAEGSRYLGATPGPGTTPLALLLTGDLGDPNVSCVSLYVLPDGTLSTTPFFQAPGAWGTVHIADVEIHPGTTYTIQSDCRPAPTDPQNLSNPASATTWLWGDVDNDGDANFTDIGLTVDAFKDIFVNATEYGTDLMACLPNRQHDFTDIGAAVDAFKSIPFSCASPCP